MYTFIDNWNGDKYEFQSLREAKKEAKRRTYGFCIYIHKGTKIVAIVEPQERPLP